MVYMSSDGLDWEPLLESWIMKKEMDEEVKFLLLDLFSLVDQIRMALQLATSFEPILLQCTSGRKQTSTL